MSSRSPRSLSLSCLLLALAATGLGCLSTPLEERSWTGIRSRHFEIWTTQDRAGAARLASDLERFRAAAEFLWGRPLPAAARPIRVLAYDGRGVERPFWIPKRDSSYFEADAGGDWIVLRRDDGWGGIAPSSLKLEIARRWFANPGPQPLPPWMEEGLAQVASTTEVRGHQVDVGVLRTDHVRELRSRQWVALPRLLAAEDLERWSDLERELFAAQTWALVHYLRFNAEHRDTRGPDPLERYVAAVARGLPRDAAARRTLGTNLRRQVWRHVNGLELDSLILEVAAPPPPETPRGVSRGEILEQLGRASLAIGRTSQAKDYFEAALVAAPGRPGALAGLGLALAQLGDSEAALDAGARAVALAPADPSLRTLAGDARLALAEAAPSGLERERLAWLAVADYAGSLVLREGDPAAQLGLARARLLAGDAEGAYAAAGRALKLLPGDLQVQDVAARAALAVGRPAEARILALRALTRARSRGELADARSLLQRIDAQAAIH